MGDGRNLIDILNLAHARTALASCVAWLLDPQAEHGLGDRVLRRLAKALGREAVHGGTLADREGVLAASSALRQEPLPATKVDVYVDEAGPYVRLVVGPITLRLQPCLDDAPPGADAVAASRAGKTTLVVLTAGPPPPEGPGERPAPAVWPLGDVAGALRGVEPRDAYGHFLVQWREHLQEQLGWIAPVDAPPSSVLRAPTPPPGAVAPRAPVPARPAPSPAAPSSAAALATSDDAVASWHDGWGSRSGEAEDWLDPLGQTGGAATEEPSAPPPPPPAGEPRRRPASSGDSTLDLDRGDQVEGARAVREALTTLQKAIHFFRLYPPEHPLCGQAIEESVTALRQFLERHGALEVQIQRDGVSFQGDRIFDEHGRATDFSFLLYPEGVRVLTFDHGITPRELYQLVETLSGRDPALNADEDLLSALWRREFVHIQYLTYDQLSPAALKSHQDSTLATVARKIAATAEALYKSAPENDAALEAFLGATPALAADDPALLATRPEQSQAFRESPAGGARQALLDDLFDPFHGDLLGRAADLVTWATTQEDHEPEPVDVAQFMAGCVINVLWQADVPRAADLLGRAEAGGPLHPDLLARLTSRDALTLVVRALRPNESSPPPAEAAAQAAIRYFAHLGAAGVTPVARAWGRLADPDVRRVLSVYLGAQVGSQPEALVPLTEHGDVAIAAEAIDMFVQATKHPKVREVLERFAKDATQPVRQQRARDAIDAASGDGERKKLLQTVEMGQVRNDRVEAARKLVEIGNAQTFDRLCALAQHRDFPQRDDEEVDAVLGAVTKLGGVRAVRLLQELAERRSLLGRGNTQRISTAATTWLNELKKTRKGS